MKIKICINLKDGTSSIHEHLQAPFLGKKLGAEITGALIGQNNNKIYKITGRRTIDGKILMPGVKGENLVRIFSKKGPGFQNIDRKNKRIVKYFYGDTIQKKVSSINVREQ
jgi:ribosomal protein S6E (S10)